MTLLGVASSATLLGSSVAAELTEEEAAVRVFLAAGGLVLLGVGLACMTVWWWRSTRPEPPALGPLEVMSDRRWRSAGDSERRRMVEELRPEGAGGREPVVAPVPVDLAQLVRDVPNFDDLRDVSLESQRPPVPVAEAGDPEALELASVQTEAPAEEPVSAVDETVAMVEPDPVERAEEPSSTLDEPVDGAGVAAASSELSDESSQESSQESSDGSADATVAQPRPLDLGHPVGRD